MNKIFKNILTIVLLQCLWLINCQAEEIYYLMPTKSLDNGLTQEELLSWNKWRADLGTHLIHQVRGILKGYVVTVTFKVDNNRNISDINIISYMKIDQNKVTYNAHLYGDKGFTIIKKKDSDALLNNNLSNNLYNNKTSFNMGQNNNQKLNTKVSSSSITKKQNKIVSIYDRFCSITVQNNKYQLNNAKVYNLKDIADGDVLKSIYKLIQKNNHDKNLTFPANTQRTSVDVEYTWMRSKTGEMHNYKESEFNDYEKIIKKVK